jgi:hypothetical protein
MVPKIIIILSLCVLFMIVYMISKLFSIIDSLTFRISSLEYLVSSSEETYSVNKQDKKFVSDSPVEFKNKDKTGKLNSYSTKTKTNAVKKHNRAFEIDKSVKYQSPKALNPTDKNVASENRNGETVERIVRVVRNPDETHYEPRVFAQQRQFSSSNLMRPENVKDDIDKTDLFSELVTEPNTNKNNVDSISKPIMAYEIDSVSSSKSTNNVNDADADIPNDYSIDSISSKPTNNVNDADIPNDHSKDEEEIRTVSDLSFTDKASELGGLTMNQMLFSNDKTRVNPFSFFNHMESPIIEIEIPIHPDGMFMKPSRNQNNPIPVSSKIEEVDESEKSGSNTENAETDTVEHNAHFSLDDELKNELMELEINNT